MSGVEITGLILGALPLAIAAIEHYQDGLKPLQIYFRYDSTLRSLRTRLRIQKDLFEGTLQRLLIDDLSDSQIETLFPDTGHAVDLSLWRTDGIEAKLQNRLGDKYENFLAVTGEMEALMRRLTRKLDVDIDQKVGSTSILTLND